jgi:hypothetical protein
MATRWAERSGAGTGEALMAAHIAGTMAERLAAHAMEALELAGDLVIQAEEQGQRDVQTEMDAYFAARVASEAACRVLRREQLAHPQPRLEIVSVAS